MDQLSNVTISPTTTMMTSGNSTDQDGQPTNHNWGFLVVVLVTVISVSVLLALLAKCKVVQRYLASYRHTRLRDGDNISQCNPSGLDVEFSVQGGHGIHPHALPQVHQDDDDGFIEDNYIQSCERETAASQARDFGDFGNFGDMEDHDDDNDDDEEMDEIQFSIS